MKKIIFYGFIILVVYKLLGGLWNKITLDEEEEVQKFTQKIEMLKSSKDFYDVSNTSREYLSFLNENIDWFTAEQSKAISTELNYLRDYAKSKIDSIDNARAAKKEEEKKRIQLEEAEKLKAEKLNAEKKTNKKKLSKSKNKATKNYCFTKKPFILGTATSISLRFYNNGTCKKEFDYQSYGATGTYQYKDNIITISFGNDPKEKYELIRNCTTLYNGSYWWNGDTP